MYAYIHAHVYTYILTHTYILSASLVLVLQGDDSVLAGVYSYSFLSVMMLFGIACILLKVKRPDIERETDTPLWVICCGIG